jgi:hypothetical protein
MSAKRWKRPERCGVGDDCGCPACNYACGYEDARQEAMGSILAAIDIAREMTPPRSTPSKRALRQYADVLEKMAVTEFDGWTSFVAEVRRRTRAEVLH